MYKRANIFTIVALSMMFVQCKTTLKQKEVYAIDSIIDSIIDPKFEYYDFTKLEKADFITNDPNEFSYKDKDSTSVDGTKFRIWGNSDSGVIDVKPLKGWFRIQKCYYSNGNIKSKLLSNKTSSGRYGKEYEYNEQGQLILALDYEATWQTSFDEVVKFATKLAKRYNYNVETTIDGKIEYGKGEYHNRWRETEVMIKRKEIKNKKYWLIGFSRPLKKPTEKKSTQRLAVLIDDATGKTLKLKKFKDPYYRLFIEIDSLVANENKKSR